MLSAWSGGWVACQDREKPMLAGISVMKATLCGCGSWQLGRSCTLDDLGEEGMLQIPSFSLMVAFIMVRNAAK